MPRKSRKVSAVAKSVAVYAGVPGNYLERKDPELAAVVIDRLANGDSFFQISKDTGLKWETICRLKARHKMALDERRTMLADDALELVEGLRLLQKEKMRMLAEDPDQLAKTSIKDLAIPWGIANDKWFAAMGENKVIVEHRKGVSLEDAMAAIAEARKKLRGGKDGDDGSIEVNVTPAKE